MNFIRQIVVFGDSILKGVLLDKSSERYYLPKDGGTKSIEQFLPIEIQNNAKFGCTIEKGYQQLQGALKKGLGCDIVVLEYGGNDCDFDWEKVAANPKATHLPHTPLDVFERVYRQMLAEIKQHGLVPLMMSLPPIDAQKYLSWLTRKGLSKENIIKWLGDVQMIYRFQELYSNTAMKIAYETGSLFVDVRSRFLDKHQFCDLLCDDGIHPNAEGQKLINQAFLDFAGSHSSFSLKQQPAV